MKVLITGSPGTGKSAIAKELGKELNCLVVNERDFALEKEIGEKGKDSGELEIPLKEIEKELNEFLKKEENVIVEGHVVCEAKLLVDLVVVLRVELGALERRLSEREYGAEKVADNVFCERIGYCKKKAEENYSRVLEVENTKDLKETVANIIQRLNEIEGK